jgi:NitT/TauT family transport system permease protein
MTFRTTSAMPSSTEAGPLTEIRPAAMRGSVLLRALRPLARLWVFGAAIAVWEATCRIFEVPAFLLPMPSAIIRAGLSVPAAEWADHVWASLKVVLMGYAAAIAVSLPLAVLIVASDALKRSIYPFLVVVQSTPVVAIAPIIVVTLGAGDLSRVVITTMIAFFPLVVGTATGLAETPPELIELSRSLRAPRRNEFLQIRIPHALPHIFGALQVSVTLAVIGTVVAEFVASEQGLGYFIRFATSYFKMPQAFAGLAVLISLSLLLFYGVKLLQVWLFPWSVAKPSQP